MFKALIVVFSVALVAESAFARFGVEPYLSISEKKTIKTNKDTGVQEETVVQRQEYGFKGNLSLSKLFKLQLSLGQSEVSTTQSETELVDEYGEIDFAADANLSGRTPGIDATLIETQRKGKFSVVLDPSFSIFLARAYFGVTATQRIVEVQEEGITLDKVEPEPTYNPHMGFGLGVRISPRNYVMAEYEFYLYSYPEMQPFERSVSIGWGIGI